jgi:hypothetical protein
VFFVISGYLISGIILKAIAEGRFSYAHFYARRIRRIFPALTVVLAGVLVAGWFLLYADDYAGLGRHAAAGAAFVSNFAFWRESSYFDIAADLKPLLHLWSLGVEEQFYLVWPLVLVTASRWRLGRRSLGEVGRGTAGGDARHRDDVASRRDLDGPDRSHGGVLCAVESILGAARRRDARVHRSRCRLRELEAAAVVVVVAA